jgi:NADH-quinone oxidoreductase subunit M
MPQLIWLFATPFLASLILLLTPSVISNRYLKRLAIILSVIPLILLIANHSTWIGAEVRHAWIQRLGIEFHLRVDAISLLFLYLTALVIPMSLFAVNRHHLPLSRLFYATVLLLQGLLIIFFTARDLALFTVAWESIILPLYFIIVFWGGAQRQKAGLKFLIYMIAGSSLMVFAVLALYFASSTATGLHTFNMDELAQLSPSLPYYAWLGAIFLLAFAVKTPLFPFHAWLPDAYTQAPTAGSILLAGLLSKAGIYGILRIGFELFSSLVIQWSPILLGLAITGVFYGALAAWRQTDFKRLIAYSSFSHVNFILVGLFIWNTSAHTGAILQAFNHGITITGLFLVAGWLERCLNTTSMKAVSGLAVYLPRLCWLTLIFVLSSVALPGTNNFIGELLIFFGLFQQSPWLAAFLGLMVILSVVYMLRWMQKVYFQTPMTFQNAWQDIHGKELAIALPLILLIFWIGMNPMPLLNQLKPTIEQTVQEHS